MPERKLKKLVSLDNIVQNQVNTQKIANKNVNLQKILSLRRLTLCVILIKLIGYL